MNILPSCESYKCQWYKCCIILYFLTTVHAQCNQPNILPIQKKCLQPFCVGKGMPTVYYKLQVYISAYLRHKKVILLIYYLQEFLPKSKEMFIQHKNIVILKPLSQSDSISCFWVLCKLWWGSLLKLQLHQRAFKIEETL